MNGRICKALFFILLILVVLQTFSQTRFELTDLLVKRLSTYNHKRCVDVTRQMRNGMWRKRSDLQPTDVLHRREQDLRIRKLRGLPENLHREDRKCGKKFPLKAPNFGLPVPSLCDPEGTDPCCNHDLTKCGSAKEDCQCTSCTDFRNIVSAELHEFVPSSGCEFQNFSSAETCQLLSKRVSSLSLIGDSLVRHLHNALMILFTDDKVYGSLAKDIDEHHRDVCSGDMQFVDSGKTACNGKTVRNVSQLPEGKFCQGQSTFEYSLQQFYSMQYAKLALQKVRGKLNATNSVIAIGVGLHMGLNAHKVFNGYIKPILQLKNQAASQWPLIIWLTTHAHGSIKPIPYIESQGNDKIIRYNQEMRRFLEPFEVPVFDTFNLTRGVHSYDGTHYGFGVNMMKAQLFLNFLDETLPHKKRLSST